MYRKNPFRDERSEFLRNSTKRRGTGYSLRSSRNRFSRYFFWATTRSRL